MYKGELRQYQKEAVDFATNRPKTLIGLPCGSGKSHIAMAVCEELQFYKILIVCPKTILNQWKGEIETWTNQKATIFDGTKKHLKKIESEYQGGYLITNYDKLRTYPWLIESFWDIVIADECTKIKNPFARINFAMRNVKCDYRMGLTGTPIENSPEDIYGIFTFITPFYFSNIRQFRNSYVIFERRQVARNRFANIVTGYKNLDKLRGRIEPFFLRKTKEEVLPELPEVVYKTIEVNMSPLQKKLSSLLYQDINDAIENDEAIFPYFIGLKLLSDHPVLLKESQGSNLIKYGDHISDFVKSPKLLALIETIKMQLEYGNTIVIFSQYAKMLGSIGSELDDLNISYSAICGNAHAKVNEESLNQFQKGDTKILLSSDIGNYGLNLDIANVIIHYDLPYNPAVYEQRIGRLHRIGQKRSILVINMLCNNAVEHRVLEILKDKKQLIDKVIGDRMIGSLLEVVRRRN